MIRNGQATSACALENPVLSAQGVEPTQTDFVFRVLQQAIHDGCAAGVTDRYHGDCGPVRVKASGGGWHFVRSQPRRLPRYGLERCRRYYFLCRSANVVNPAAPATTAIPSGRYVMTNT